MNYGLILTLLCLFFLSLNSNQAWSNQCEINYDLTQESEIYRDRLGTLPFESIQNQPFKTLKKSSFGFTNDAIWIKTSINLPQECAVTTKWRLEISPPYTDYIDIYWLSEANTVVHRRLGDRLEEQSKPLYLLPNIELPSSLLRKANHDTPAEIYVRIQGKNSLAIQLMLTNEQLYLKNEKEAYMASGLAFGFILLLGMVSIIQFLLLKNTDYILFGLLNVSLFFVGLLVYGLSNLFFAPFVGDVLATLSQALSPLLLFLLVASFLDLRVHFYKTYLAHLILFSLVLIWAVVSVNFDQISWSLPWTHLVTISTLFSMLTYSILLWKKVPLAPFFFLLIFLIFVSYGVQFSALSGYINHNFLTKNSPSIALLVDILFIYAALNYHAVKEHLAKAIIVSQATEAINEAKLRRLFTNLFSHEIRTPLAIISASNRNLNEGKKALPPFLQESLIRQKQAIQDIEYIADLCLTQERLKGLQSSELYLVKDIWAAVKSKADELIEPSNRKLCCNDLSLLTAASKSDSINLQQVLIAFSLILDNALKYSTKNSEILITLECDKNYIIISITNQGAGFSESTKDLTPFKRGDHVSGIPGVGIGLVLTKELIEKMHGELLITNCYEKTLNPTHITGSKVSLTIPLAKV